MLNMDAASAQKRKLYDSRLKIHPQLEGIWFEDAQGNKIDSDSYTTNIGDFFYLVIQANKDADGETAVLDLDDQACNYQLVGSKQKHNGFIENMVLSGDSYDPKKPNRKLDNLSRFKLVAVEQTQKCLTAYAQRKNRVWCKKRSWPLRRRNTHKTQSCPE